MNGSISLPWRSSCGATGIALGLCGAAAATRLLASWLYGVTPLDLAQRSPSLRASTCLFAVSAVFVCVRLWGQRR